MKSLRLVRSGNMDTKVNHPFVVWGTCFLWIASMFAITWSLVLFFSIGDMLMITGMDVVIALTLLSGLIMFPTNVFMLYTIGNGHRLNHKSRVLCCPLWVLIMWIIIVNCIGIFLCIERVCVCNTLDFIAHSMKNYRTVSRYKRFMDNLQWSLKCCGLDSYKDWFNCDWYEKIRDYEWNPSKKNANLNKKKDILSVSDSVPLSCCKSGTCVPNYLMELGTHSIYTKGCNKSLYRVYMTSLNFHFIIFFTVVIAEVIILSCIMAKTSNGCEQSRSQKRNNLYNVKHLMPVNNKFLESNSSASICLEEESEISN